VLYLETLFFKLPPFGREALGMIFAVENIALSVMTCECSIAGRWANTVNKCFNTWPILEMWLVNICEQVDWRVLNEYVACAGPQDF